MTVNKSVQTVDISKHDWKAEPYRLDPNRGYLLCRPCWDGQHFDPPYRDGNNHLHQKVANCKQGSCHCGCRPEFAEKRKRIKFTNEGQTSLLSDDVIQIGPNS